MIDWSNVARSFWGYECSAPAMQCAARIDNFGRALAGAGMLACVELRAYDRAYALALDAVSRHYRDTHAPRSIPVAWED